MEKRIVITGYGLIGPNDINGQNFIEFLKEGKSGINKISELSTHNFICQVGGIPEINDEKHNNIFKKFQFEDSELSIKYSLIAGLECWNNANLLMPDFECTETNESFGAIIGTTFGGIDVFIRKVLPFVSNNNVKKIGSQIVEQWMSSGSVAMLSRLFALSNQTTSNSAACSTSLEAIVMSYDRIKSGKAKLMLAGGTDPYSPYCWAGFDSMRLLCRSQYEEASMASRPMSASASGFVPSAGAGMLVIEDLENAIKRDAPIYAEIVGADVNSGGQRNGGSMTFPNPKRVVDCIQSTLNQANIKGNDIDLISGHLTGTKADKIEIANWIEALSLKENIPFINAPKSMLGHMIGAAGAVETIACVLQLHHDFIHPSINCEDLHPEIEKLVPREKIPMQCIENAGLKYIAKASFGFGDVNSCIILKKFS